ncbi:hypothetical protein KVV02_004101 [Mortierella alpina]|uniref:TPX2 C-terminal domain-containing protein n=1 Tax=Mortierella alpina TaxID=64518 RepID=A0A9P8CYK9_MORAP|nr:hypothetical protein KVV02_004101 [Mortierella alpina]
MDSPSRQSSIIESPSLRKHRDMFPARHSRSSLPSFAPSSTTPLKSPSTPHSKRQEQSIFYSAEHDDSDGDQGHHSPSPAGPPVFKVPTFLSRRAAASSTSQAAGATLSVSALHLHQAAEMEDSLARLLDDHHQGETNASHQARVSMLKARKSLDSLRQSQRRSLDSIARSPSVKSVLPPRLRTTETEYDVSPSRTARLMSTPAASSFAGTPSRRGRDFDEQVHVSPENLATLEWLQQTANASDNDQNQYAAENTERLDQKYTRQTSIIDEEQEQQQYEDTIITNRRASSQRSYYNSPSGHRRSSQRAHDTYSEKENIPAYSDRTAPQGRPSPKSPKYIERVLEPRTPEPNHSVIEAESSLLEVAETTTTLTNELRGVYTKMQDFFSPETEAKLNGAISVIGSQKVSRVAKGLTSSTTKPRPLDFRSASVRRDYRTPSSAKHSSRPLTEPIPFNFSERLDRLQKRHTPHLVQKSGGRAWSTPRSTTVMQHKQHHRDEIAHRPSTPPVQSRTANEYQEMSKSPFIPLDQRKRLLAKSTNIHSEAKRPLTQPKSPVLLTRTRQKSNMDHHQEHLDHEATHHHGYRAHTLDRRIFEQGGISGVPKVTKQPLTVPKSPVFTKRRPAPLRSAVMPSKPNVHHSQQLDNGRIQTDITQRSLVSSAESARRLSEERQNRRHDLGLGHHSVRGRAQSAKPALTVPEPFSFVTDARGERYQEQFRNKLGKWRQIEKEQQFKALPLPEYPDMFVPMKSTKPLTHTEPVVLQTDRRAEEREVYEQERRRKEQLLQDMLAEKAREDELRELQELRELRKRLVPHPTPIRDYPRIEIHKSTRPLTIPHSPNIGEKRKRQMTLEREISSSHEDHYHHHQHQHQHAVPASTHGQYTREDLEQLERELQRERERAQDQDFERRRVSGTHLRDSGEQQQRQDLVRQEIERQRETDAYHRHELELQKQQQQRQQQYARRGYATPAAEDQEEVMNGYDDEEHGHSKRQRFPENDDPARAPPSFYPPAETVISIADTTSESNDAPEEPVTEAILLWRALMKETESKEAARRWYFKNKLGDEYDVPGSSVPLRPETVAMDDEEPWRALLPLKGEGDQDLPLGSYWLVFCVSWKDLNFDTLESIELDGNTGDLEGLTYSVDNLTKTILSKEDLKDIPTNDFTRLRLHRQINVDESAEAIYPKITITTTAGTETNPSFQLHYVELGSTNFRSSSGDKGRPDRFIRIGAYNSEPVTVSAYAFSELGNYAVTFHITPGMGHIDIWDLRRPSKKKLRGIPQPMTLPIASHSFKVAEEVIDTSLPGDLYFNAAISSTGSQVAVCSNADMGNGKALSLAVFRGNPTAPADHDLTKAWPLKRFTDISKDLVNTLGEITFRSTNPETSREQDERFFKFDGVSLEIYSTHGRWNRVFVLSAKIDWMARALTADSLFRSIRGRLMVYTGIKGLVSIWDYEAGKIISNISVPEDSKTVWASLSRDGSMVAVSVKGEIHAYDVATTIKIGVYKEALDESNRFQMDFGQDYLLTNNYETSDSEYSGVTNARSIVRVSDMSIIRTFSSYEELVLQTPQANGQPIFAFALGSIVNIHEFGDLLTPVEDSGCDIDCDIGNDITFQHVIDGDNLEFASDDGTVFQAKAFDVYAPRSSYTKLSITVEDDEGTVTQQGVICLGVARYYHEIFYVPSSSQLFVLASCYLHVWNLLVTDTSVCELAYVWKLQEDDPEHADDYASRTIKGVKTCSHGQRVQLILTANGWFRDGIELVPEKSDLPNDVMTVPMTAADTIKISEEDRLVQGVSILVTLYPGCDLSVKEGIIQYLKNHIRPSFKHPESTLVTISRTWTPANRTSLEAIVSRLLPTKRITWIPDTSLTKSTDPLAILLSTAETQPRVIGLVRVILDYCVSHANRTKNLAFMGPIFASMHELMEFFPEAAQECMSGISYIPAKQRSFIMDNHIIAHPPKVRMQFWNMDKKRLADSKNPILQLHESEAVPDPTNDKFTLPVFVAAFDALWNYKDNTNTKSKNDALAKTARPNGTTWWKTVYHMFLLKLQFRSHTYVECHNFSLEFFDNPAIAALVAYKWNTIGFMYWLLRFVFQCIFYFLVTVAALLQVYYKGPDKIHLAGVFIAIIVFGFTFLWLELLQASKNWNRYASIYNILDMIAYTVPVAASIDQLVILLKGDVTGNTRILSFSVLAVFIHAVSPLINVAFTKGDDSWRLVWIESRLRYIESAENMSYHIPGFRQSHNWFPKEIYYAATLQEVRAYREKYDLKASKNKDRDLLEDWGRDDSDEEEESQGAARTRKLGASQQDDDDASSTSVNGEAKENNEEEQQDQDGDNNEDEDDDDGWEDEEEEVVDVDGDEGEKEEAEDQDKDKDKDEGKDASAVKDLKVQVVKLQRQVSQQLKAQQEMHEQSQRQLQELRELLLAQNRA